MKYEKQRIDSAALHRISCSCVGALSSVALFRCIFSFGTFFGFIRVYTVLFSDPTKSEGYFIKCIFVLTVDASVNVARVSARVALGGHDVCEALIRSRYVKSLDNIKRLMEICDILHVYDNTEEPVRIIRKHKDDISIFPNDLWSEEKILKLINSD